MSAVSGLPPSTWMQLPYHIVNLDTILVNVKGIPSSALLRVDRHVALVAELSFEPISKRIDSFVNLAFAGEWLVRLANRACILPFGTAIRLRFVIRRTGLENNCNKPSASSNASSLVVNIFLPL